MRTIIAKTFSNSSPLSAKRSHFQWMMLKKGDPNKPKKDHINNANLNHHDNEEEEEDAEILAFSASSSFEDDLSIATPAYPNHSSSKKKSASSVASNAVSRLRSAVLTVMNNHRKNRQGGLGPCVTGTIFGRRRGRVHLAFQMGPKSAPALLVELDMPTSTLVREMSSGLVRIALECHRTPCQEKRKSALLTSSATSSTRKLLEEPTWRAYCNGKKCGYATRRECGPADWRLLRAVEPVSVGAGVLPVEKGDCCESGSKTSIGADSEGDVMYMRAKFERVAGSKDSEAFYMLNPDGNGGPELSIYLLRV
ncbi:protein MIZU-KUSSEI 1-like [Carex rostrata]